MTKMAAETQSRDAAPVDGGVLLCVVDETEELWPALRFACRKANRLGARVGLLCVVEPAEFQHWLAVGELMRAERREEAEETLQLVATAVQKQTGKTPVLYIREGNVRDELLSVIEEEKRITLLILGAATGTEGPGPLISFLVQKKAGGLRVPITIVPGNLTEEEIDAIT
jgi:nucleotide-binding universal stress UspA family protein